MNEKINRIMAITHGEAFISILAHGLPPGIPSLAFSISSRHHVNNTTDNKSYGGGEMQLVARLLRLGFSGVYSFLCTFIKSIHRDEHAT